ncbi:MAG: hypothetical protein U1E67_11860 [Hyphomicrobiales bacterium]
MLEHPSSLPDHGRVACSKCFPGPAEWNKTELRLDGWHVVNNPMSWGTATPRFLLLGVSKGTTQCDAIAAKPHDKVPFDGFRPALTKALQVLGLLKLEEVIDEKFSAAEKEWSFGSMVRCALGLPQEDQSIERSGTVIQRLAAMPIDDSWITRCSSAFLGALPTSLRVVILLSNDDRYVDACFAAIRRLRPSTRKLNAVSYGDEQITWVHIIHVGGPGKNHITAWFEGEGTQGDKRRAAQAAVRHALGGAAHQDPIAVPHSILHVPEAKEHTSKAPSQSRGEGKPIPPNPVRDSILGSMRAHWFFVQHPAETEADGTKYVSAFLGKNGRVIAFDKAVATKQPMWVRDEPRVREQLERLGLSFDAYPPEKGRNSNLGKLPEFKGQALLRIFPPSEDQAIAFVERVTWLPIRTEMRMYHAAPTNCRASIFARGLVKSLPETERKAFDLDDSAHITGGIFLSSKKPTSSEYIDVWEVDVSVLDLFVDDTTDPLEPDDSYWVVYTDIPPSRLKLLGA